MAEEIGLAEVGGMLRSAAEAIKVQQNHLSKLDAAIGDGDHGSAMGRVADTITAALDKESNSDIKTLLRDIGWTAMSAAGGSTSTLYGSFFMGLSEAAGDRQSLDCGAVAELLEGGTAKLRKHSKAELGAKTLIDALVPAVEAVREAADSGLGIAEALERGCEAAAKGAEATKDMVARFGRAKNLGERTIGHMDPGAASMTCFLTGLKEGI
jgi:phosphoenolpyruvate---glycerone phosphotransferase subunit DhaL